MTYDLRRLRLAGLIQRLPRSNRYIVTADGIRISVFYNKPYHRLLVPLTAANQPQAHQNYAPHCPQSTDTSMFTPRTLDSAETEKLDTILKNLLKNQGL